MAVWWARRAAGADALDRALATYPTALPAPDAPVDTALARLGADVFEARCAACHAVTGTPHVGPDLLGVTERRSLTWIRSMILRPDSMTRDDPMARDLKNAYGGLQMMVPGGMDAARTRAVVEFLRRVDAQGGS